MRGADRLEGRRARNGCATKDESDGKRSEERFLSAQADPFTGVKGKKKSACSVRNDGRGEAERLNVGMSKRRNV